MSEYGLNRKTYRERKVSNPEYEQVHDRLVLRIVHFLRLLGCGVYVASVSDQRERKFDFKTKAKGERAWTAWDVKVAARLPRQFSGPMTELNIIRNLLTWQGLERFNNNNHVFWLLTPGQARKSITDTEYDGAARRIAERIASGKTLKNIVYYARGANREDRERYKWRVGRYTMRQALLETNYPLLDT